MIQRRNASLAGLLSPDLFKNRGECYWSFIHVNAAYAAAKESVILVTTAAVAIVVTLPVAANNPAKVYAIKKIDAGVGTVDITPQGAELLDGVTPYQLLAQYDTVIIANDSANWWVVG